MPLVRVEVRNEYGLGLPDLYKEANKDDPKAVLDGVAVAGLVGILRQLGDLAEFAAEVFHGLQEQVMITSSRSHKLMVRVQNVEAAFPPVEKALLAQRSHLHFAYTAGSHWHLRVRSEQNHFIYSDLPRFIMDSYEECREPPRLHLLDKFDSGGPGSCLKRYSDPTFFRKASAGSDETNVEKVSRDKKARRRKKKRAWLRNGEMPHDVPISNHSARTQFDSPKFGGQSSPSQTVSTSDVALKSDLGVQSNSFDSRIEPGYIDCVFRPSYARESEEREPKEFSSSRFKMHHNETFDSASLDEQSGVVDEDIQHSLSQEQTGPTSSSVTWDEKTEIMEPTGQQYDHDETTEMLATSFDLNNQEAMAFNSNTVDQIDFHFDDENMPTSVSCANEVDDVESETDNYVDALNTIESELEADLDCQTKREVEHFYALNNTLKDEMHDGLTAHHSDGHPSNFEKRVAAHVSSNGTIFGHNPNSVSLESHTAPYSSSNNGTSECYVYSQLPQTDGKPAILDTSPGIELHGNADIAGGSNVETVVSNVSSSGSRELSSLTPMTNKIISSPFESQKSSSLPSGVMFWTNGGLLGLEPSKPPDFSVLNNSVSQGSVAKSKDDSILPSSQSDILERDGHPVKPDVVVKSSKSIEHGPSSKCSSSCDNDQENGLSLKKIPQRFSPADLDVKLEQSSKEDGNSSRMFEFSSRLLANGFRRQMSLDDDNHVSSVKSGVSEEKSQNRAYQTFSRKAIKEPFGSGCPVTSPSSSPPLEHMKISFQPIDGFETSKLKLKLREESDCRESSGDMFPSFQLVPEPAISQHVDGSDSDDDTFCRSSPYMSDDYLSDHSDSNSELWESGESPRSKDHELYDALRRISTTESISSSLEIGVTAQGGIPDNSKLQSAFIEDGIEFSHSGRLLDLPGFDSLNPSCKEELGNDSNERLHFPKEPTPPPPPLPPLEWRGVKPHPDMATEKQDSLSEPLDYAFHSKLLAPIISQQPKPAPVKQDLYIEAAADTPKSEPDWQKLIKHKEANQAVNGKVVDEKEDFLHQIRAKSFNLRSTGTARPTLTPGAPTTNVKVTAILEKANAIRQAVGSDDGEDDDNWSDT